MSNPQPLALFIDTVVTPLAPLLVVVDQASRLRALDFVDYEARCTQLLRRHYGASGEGYTLQAAACPSALKAALAAYFSGEFAALDEIHVATGGTAFQREVWAALRRIPAGSTTSYGALAIQIGRPQAVRAVGLANGANPIGIVVPCHRVIGANGKLTGYAGGLSRKAWLLAHEGHGGPMQPLLV